MAERKHLFSWRQAILESKLKPTTRLVLHTLACHMNAAGESCFPSIKTLCQESGLSNRAVIDHIRIAEAGGWIKTEKHGFAGREWARNEYRISWPLHLQAVSDVHHVTETPADGGEAGSPPRTESDAPQVAQDHQQGSEPPAPLKPPQTHEAVNVIPQGGEPHDVKAVSQVHTNSSVSTSYNSSEERPKKKRASKPPKEEAPLPGNLHLDWWTRWLEYRKEMRFPPYKTNRQANNLALHPHFIQIKTIEYSMTNEYKGLFPERFSQQTPRGGNHARPTKKFSVWDSIHGSNQPAEQTTGADPGYAGGSVVILQDGSIVQP